MWLNHANQMPPSLVQVTQLPAFLDFPRRCLPNNFHYTGPWMERLAQETVAFPWERLDGRPLIYASLGTLQNRLESAYALIAQACARLDAQLVLSHGRKDTPQIAATENNAVVVGYAPQLALLRRASLVISHGGLNTTLEAISQGLPLVLIPITNDQPGIAARAKRLGVGEFIPFHKLSVARLREAIDKVMSSRTYRDAATKCAQWLADIDGLACAAELIDRALTSGCPVYRSR
jgi:MGT family glycosyltransferase